MSQYDAEIALLSELIRIQRSVIEVAVTESPEAAVDMVAEYFEEAGVDDGESRRLLDLWWAGNAHRTRVNQINDRSEE